VGVTARSPISLGRPEAIEYKYVEGRKRRLTKVSARELLVPLCGPCYRWYRWGRNATAVAAIGFFVLGIGTAAGCYVQRSHDMTYGLLSLVFFALGFLTGGLDRFVSVAVERATVRAHPKYETFVSEGYTKLRREVSSVEWHEPQKRRLKKKGARGGAGKRGRGTDADA
jgi:hypothetical protein